MQLQHGRCRSHAVSSAFPPAREQVTWLYVDVSIEPRYRDLYASHREWVDAIAEKMHPHTVARTGAHVAYRGKRTDVHDANVPWEREWLDASGAPLKDET